MSIFRIAVVALALFITTASSEIWPPQGWKIFQPSLCPKSLVDSGGRFNLDLTDTVLSCDSFNVADAAKWKVGPEWLATSTGSTNKYALCIGPRTSSHLNIYTWGKSNPNNVDTIGANRVAAWSMKFPDSAWGQKRFIARLEFHNGFAKEYVSIYSHFAYDSVLYSITIAMKQDTVYFEEATKQFNFMSGDLPFFVLDTVVTKYKTGIPTCAAWLPYMVMFKSTPGTGANAGLLMYQAWFQVGNAMQPINFLSSSRPKNLFRPIEESYSHPSDTVTPAYGNIDLANGSYDHLPRFISDVGMFDSTDCLSVLTHYFGWNILDSLSQTFPYITKILYSPPGYGSATSLSSTTTLSGQTTIGNGYSISGSAYAAIDVHLGCEVGFLGTGVSMNTFDASAKLGFKYDANSDNSNTYSYSLGINKQITTAGEDVIITEDRTIKSYLLRRRMLASVMDVTAGADNVTSKNCSNIFNLPASISEMQPYAFSNFVSKYGSNKDVMKNFLSLYAKDTASGKIRPDYLYKGAKISSLHLISKGADEAGSKSMQTSVSSTQSFSWSAGPFAELCVEVCGVGAGGSLETMFSSSKENTAATDTQNVISYNYTCPFKWDQIHTDIYEDALFGSRLYQPDSLSSFTTSPREKQTSPSVEFTYKLIEPAKITVGDSATYFLDIKNVSPKSNNMLAAWKPEMDGFTVSDALSSIYLNKVTFAPNDIVIPQDSTVRIKIHISSVPDTIPFTVWAHYGYRDVGGDFVDANWDEISTANNTPVKQPVAAKKPLVFGFNCVKDAFVYTLPKESNVSIKVFNLQGKFVAEKNSMEASGMHVEHSIHGKLIPGMYVVRFDAGTFNALRVLQIVR